MSAPIEARRTGHVPTRDGTARLWFEAYGEGAPLVLIHGWPFDRRVFAPQVPVLSAAFRVILYDRRGFGRSGGTPDLGADVDDLAALLDHLGIERAHLLGMSQGGRVALRFAVLNPGRVRSLILQAPAVDGLEVDAPDEEVIPMADYARWARQGHVERVRAHWLAHPMIDSGVESREVLETVRALLEGYQGQDLTADPAARQASMPEMLGALEQLDVPTLLLTGEAETAARRSHADHLVRHLPDAREVLFTRSGHLSNLSEPEKYNREVTRFCQRADSAAQ